ncbi:TBC1D5_1 [Blepharisma stoltei]|uniref:Rab-GAP TBC domain-containing protein n=1 Tax=Blepharisma stoltei TaxID=1481888 RepID=A0AAU9IIB3_9CILI|nr:unnamed protein product [Blepharisma stoltei]
MAAWYFNVSLKEIKETVLQGDIKNRFVIWKILLGVLQGSPSDWVSNNLKLREEYNHMKSTLTPSINLKQEGTINNPLSTSTDSPWYTHFKYQEVRRVIRIDVDRTYQKYQIFQDEHNKNLLENILFVWSATHPIGYNQGLNEICAVIMYAVLNDSETEDGLTSWEYIEADCYWIFSKIMELSVEELFVHDAELTKTGPNTLDESACYDRSILRETPEMVRRSHYIFHRILSATDPTLYTHIQKSKYDPQLFFVRWLRCLLSREFTLSQTLLVWDKMFACHNINNRELELLNYICAAMLSADRENLLQTPCADLLEALMNPLVINDISLVLNQAISYFEEQVDKKNSFLNKWSGESGILTNSLKMLYKMVSSKTEYLRKKPKKKEVTLESMLLYVSQSKQMIEEQIKIQCLDRYKIKKTIKKMKYLLEFSGSQEKLN